ncbi:Superoxide dismutase [Mn] [Candidatus Providencia siddallii]|uniref:Superoxide dismutase n=1 Tax=Candidatus Providencia siddallii TaxID=1715285 RepID=A0A0M6W6V0_9GAMM|nr:Superoxide dismutase [Mn] [Candidatus Providencia siddallii]
MNYKLPDLLYDYDYLEPFFDKQTMEIHHTKHHQTYVSNTNLALEKLYEFSGLDINLLIQKIDEVPFNQYNYIRNNVGGHFNHTVFFKGLKLGTKLKNNLKDAINRDFGSFENFKELFEKTAISCFGSGWIWLILKNTNKLDVVSTHNQDNPLMRNISSEIRGYPIICLDVWEHAYYLKFQNRRSEYVKSFWFTVNWDEANKRFESKVINKI